MTRPFHPGTWILRGLPGASQEIEYTFEICRLDYIDPQDKDAVYLHIPEHPNRNAEGQPRHPEQAQWIRAALLQRGIVAREVWWSHWRFGSLEDVHAFEAILREAGAHLRNERPSSRQSG